MGTHVDLGQIRAASLSTEQFRETVNYQNTKNKGYVRFTLDKVGSVRLEKINNKVDILVGLRTNIDREHNLAMRAKFADALSRDLRLADSANVQAMRERILGTDGQLKGNALARKELQALFQAYDQEMNTTAGRTAMLNRLFEQAARRCGANLSPDDFRANYLRLSPELADLDAMTAATPDQPDGPTHMAMDEMTFKLRLAQLEQACDLAVQRAKLENVFQLKAEAIFNPNNDDTFGLKLSQDDTAKIRAALHRLLGDKYGQFEASRPQPGSMGAAFNAFIDHVLPKLFRKSVEDIRNASQNADTDLQFQTHFSFDTILAEADAFLRQANDFLLNPPDLSSDGALAQLAKAANTSVLHSTVISCMNEMIANTDFSAQTGFNLRAMLLDSIEAHGDDARLALFTAQFLAERGLGEPVDDLPEQQSKLLHATVDAIVDHAHKAGIAAQIQYGTVTVAQDGTRVRLNSSMDTYLSSMEKAIDSAVAGADNDPELLQNLLTFTLANIVNGKVAKVVSGEDKDLHLGYELASNDLSNGIQIAKNNQRDDAQLLQSTAEAYLLFEASVQTPISRALQTFGKALDRQVRSGRLDPADRDAQLANARKTLDRAHHDALRSFFLKSPCTDPDSGRRLLDRLFRAQLQQANAQLNAILALNALDKATGVQFHQQLLDANTAIHTVFEAPELQNTSLGQPGIITAANVQQKLCDGALARLHSNVLGQHLQSLAKRKTDHPVAITEAFVTNVQQDFTRQAITLVKTCAKGQQTFLSRLRRLVADQLQELFSNGEGRYAAYADKLSRDERRQLVDAMTTEIMLLKTDAIRAALEEYLDAPETYGDDLKGLAQELFDDRGPGSVGVTFARLAAERQQAVTDWLAGDRAKQPALNLLGQAPFAPDGALQHLADAEKGALAQRLTDTILTRVRELPLRYASSNPDAITDRVTDEALHALQDKAAAYAKFRQRVLDGLPKAEADFLGLGQENLARLRDALLQELAATADLDHLDPKLALQFYRRMLNGELNKIIADRKMSFAEYAQKVSENYLVAMPRIRACLEDYITLIRKDTRAYVTDEAITHFQHRFIPQFLERCAAKLYQNPDDFSEQNLDQTIQHIDDHVVNGLDQLLWHHGITRDSNLDTQIRRAGYEDLLADSADRQAAVNAIRTLLNTPQGHALYANAQTAIMDHLLDHLEDFDPQNLDAFQPTAPDNGLAQLQTQLKELMHPFSVSRLHEALRNDSIASVRQLFERWLDSHALAKTIDYRGTTARERIMALFATRIATLQQRQVALDAEQEPILTPDFIRDIDRILDSDATQALLSEWKNTQTTRFIRETLDNPAYHHAFNTSDSTFSQLPERLKTIVRENRAQLDAVISMAFSQLGADAVGLDGLDEAKAALDTLTRRIDTVITPELNTLHIEALRRYDVEKNRPDMLEQAETQLNARLTDHIFSGHGDFSHPMLALGDERIPAKLRDQLATTITRALRCGQQAFAAAAEEVEAEQGYANALQQKLEQRVDDIILALASDKAAQKLFERIRKALA